MVGGGAKVWYLELVRILELEVQQNNIVADLLNYLKSYENHFLSENSDVDEQKEIVRQGNRYADEFNFSEQRNTEIRKMFSDFYNYLNSIKH